MRRRRREKQQKHIYLLDSTTIGLMAEAEDRRWSRGKTSTDEEEDEFQEKKEVGGTEGGVGQWRRRPTLELRRSGMAVMPIVLKRLKFIASVKPLRLL